MTEVTGPRQPVFMKKKLLLFSVMLFIIVLAGFKIKSLTVKAEFYDVPNKNSVIALNYHRVRKNNLGVKITEIFTQSTELTKYSVYEDTFREQIDTLISNDAYFATPSEIMEFIELGEFPEKCVWISFDDVDKSVYEVAYPILKEKNIPFTLFVISSKVGSNDFNNMKMATWDDLREMRDSGLVTFGSHTHDMHYLEDDRAVFLEESNFEQFEKDIQLSKRIIESNLGISIDSIAYPFGESSDEITEIVSRNGFDKAYILSPNPITVDNSSFYQNRYLIDRNNFNDILMPWFDLHN